VNTNHEHIFFTVNMERKTKALFDDFDIHRFLSKSKLLQSSKCSS